MTNIPGLIERLEAVADRAGGPGRGHMTGTSLITASEALEAASTIRTLVAEKERLREALKPFAEQATIDEIMRGKVSDDWLRASPERRVEMMGERKRRHAENILRARNTLSSLNGGEG